jgi:hypothetical protein
MIDFIVARGQRGTAEGTLCSEGRGSLQVAETGLAEVVSAGNCAGLGEEVEADAAFEGGLFMQSFRLH